MTEFNIFNLFYASYAETLMEDIYNTLHHIQNNEQSINEYVRSEQYWGDFDELYLDPIHDAYDEATLSNFNNWQDNYINELQYMYGYDIWSHVAFDVKSGQHEYASLDTNHQLNSWNQLESNFGGFNYHNCITGPHSASGVWGGNTFCAAETFGTGEVIQLINTHGYGALTVQISQGANLSYITPGGNEYNFYAGWGSTLSVTFFQYGQVDVSSNLQLIGPR